MANLKAGTLIGGNLIWNAGNLPLKVVEKNLFMVDAQVYTTAFKPSAADVNAVAKTGDTMTGPLVTTRLKVTDQYALTTESGGTTQGVFLGFSGSDRRTIIGGGDASAGTVLIRPRGIGDANASTIFNTNGTISAAVDGTSSSHLVRKGQVDAADNLRMLKAGDTMTGKLILGYPSALKLPAGTSAQRGSGVAGDFRFNTDDKGYEGYDGSEWQPIGSGRVAFKLFNANFTAVKGKGHLIDTRQAGIVATLPSDAKDSDFVVIGDGSGNAFKNPFYVAGFNGDRVLVDRDNCILRFSYFGNKWVIVDGIGEAGALDSASYLKLSGGVMTGTINMNTRSIIGINELRTMDDQILIRRGGDQGVVIGNVVGKVTIDCMAGSKISVRDGGSGGKSYDVYTTGNKPTAAELGVVPSSDVTLSGEFGKIPRISANAGVLEIGRFVDFHYASATDDYNSRMEVAKNSDGINYTLQVHGSNFNVTKELYEKGQRVFSPNNKPLFIDNTIFQIGSGADGKGYGSGTIRANMTDMLEIASTPVSTNNASTGIVFHNRSASTSALYFKNTDGSNGYFNFVSDEGKWDVRVNNRPIYHEGNNFGLGVRNNDSIVFDAIDYTEDKTRDFNKLIRSGVFTVSGNWKNAVNGTGAEQSLTGIVEVLVRKFTAGPAVFQRFYTGISQAVGNGSDYWERTSTGEYPNQYWSRWRRNGTWEHNLGYRMTIERNGDTAYPYITLHKKDLRTDIAATSWYTANAIQMKDGPMSDVHNPDSGKLGLLLAMQKKGDQSENRVLIQCRDPNGSTKNEMIMHQESTSFSKPIQAKSSITATGRIAAPEVQIKTNAGLKFSEYDDLKGVSWGVGMDGTNGVLGIHKYADGKWVAQPFAIDNNHVVHTGHLMSTGAIRAATDSLSAWGQDGDRGFAPSSGSSTVNMTTGQWCPFVTSPIHLNPAEGYTMRWQLGAYRVDANHNCDFVINMTGDGYLSSNLRYHFTDQGDLASQGQASGGYWKSSWLGYECSRINENIIDWSIACFAPISDETKKRNIKPAVKSALDDVMQIEFKSYDWNEDAPVAKSVINKHTNIGLIAHEMEALDDAYTKDIETYNPDGSIEESIKALDMTNCLALALKAIQELQAQIDELKRK